MNILQLTTRFRTGGIATYIEVLSAALKKRGHTVTVVASSGSAVPLLEKESISFQSLPLETKFEWHPKLWFAGRHLEEIMRANKIDIIHAHTRVTQVLANLVSKRSNIPMVTTCHGFYPPRWGRKLFPSWGERVIAISEEVETHLEEVLHVDPAKITVVENAVPVERLQESLRSCDRQNLRKQFGFDETDFVVGCISRLERVKGHEFLLRATQTLSKDFPFLKLLIVGDGSEKERLIRFVKKTGLRDRVTFVGEMTDVAPAIAAMDLFVSPQTWEEGFGLSVGEALVCGLPVIVSGTGALRRIIKDHQTGILVEPANARALARAIGELISNGELRAQIAKAAQSFALEAFSPEKMARKIEKIYEDVIAGRPATGLPRVEEPKAAV